MSSTPSQMQTNKIEDLIDLMGRDWVDEQLELYTIFRASSSPKDLWSHREPSTSPVIPAIFAYRSNPGKQYGQSPVGYWYGEPIIFLAELAEQVFLFRPYWESLPNGNGQYQLKKHLLKDPGRFPSFQQELMVATHYDMEQEFEVEPVFLDPASEKGQPDIVLRKEGLEIGIQCKSRSPYDAKEISFDLFQYLAGLLIRLVEDTGRSARFSITVKAKLTKDDIDQIFTRATEIINSGICMPFAARYVKYDLLVRPLKVDPPGVSADDLQVIKQQPPGNNFVVVAGLSKDETLQLCSKVAVVAVSCSEPLEFTPWAASTAAKAAKESPSTIPMIISLHYFGSINLSLLTEQESLGRLGSKNDEIFANHPNIHSIQLSFGNESHLEKPSGTITPQTEFLNYKNPTFEGPPLPENGESAGGVRC